MSAAAGALPRHAGLWQSDPWYRLAWVVWPQVACLLIAGWLLSSPSNVREAAAPWAKPIIPVMTAAQFDALRNQAETDPQALDRLRQMANSGNAGAQFSLGTLFDPDFKAPAKLFANDMNTAIGWHEKAAEHGHSIAQQNLAAKYYEGRWVPTDYSKANFWARKAADQGNPAGERMLGWAKSGSGQSANETYALQWFKRAADHGDSFSEAQVADAYRSGEGFALNQTEALNWYRKAAAQKNAYAQMRIGEVYLNGTGVERNLDQAFRYFQQGANGGNAAAEFYLGAMYDQGLATPADPTQAFQWFKKAADSGNADAQNALWFGVRPGPRRRPRYGGRPQLARESAAER